MQIGSNKEYCGSSGTKAVVQEVKRLEVLEVLVVQFKGNYSAFPFGLLVTVQSKSEPHGKSSVLR